MIDVRTPAEYESARIPGSHNLPLDTLQRHADRLRDLDSRKVVLVCCSTSLRAAPSTRPDLAQPARGRSDENAECDGEVDTAAPYSNLAGLRQRLHGLAAG